MAARRVIEMLTEQHKIDLVGLRYHLGNRTKFGKKSHPKDVWGYTKEYLVEYNPHADIRAIITLFESQGVKGDLECGRWLLLHDSLVP